MPRVVIQSANDLPPAGAFPAQPGVTLAGEVSTTAVIAALDRPLSLWLHDLKSGAQIAFDNPPVGHVLYVLSGAVSVDGRTVSAADAVIIEHHSKTTLRVEAPGARLAQFHERPGQHAAPPRAGGHVHAGNHSGVYASVAAGGRANRTSFADSGCPTCELWLHRTSLPANFTVNTHYHTESEIIVVLEGSLVVGRNMLGPLSALAIDADTHYKFEAGPEGLRFMNFRATEPYLVQKQADGSFLSFNEREFAKSSGKMAGTRVPARGGEAGASA